jgi:flavin-dependent dehydrogenase
LNETDVFVIGGGPAGLAAAIAARLHGFRVMLADGVKPPIDKACGEVLMPDATVALKKLGVDLPHDSCSLRGVRFLASGLSAEAAFPSECVGLSVRRTDMHRILVERAMELGVDLLWQSAVTGISDTGVRVGHRRIKTAWVIGADGSNSRVRQWAGLKTATRTKLRYAFRRHYRVAPWTDRMEIYWGKHSQAYATAVTRDEVCVAAASSDPHLRLEEAISEFPDLSERLRGAEATSTERGAVSANCKLRRVWRKNVALIGDASGTVDAITGEGLDLAFSQALALANCLKNGSFAAYQSAHRSLALRPSLMARLMLTLDGRPRLQRRTLQVLRRRPEIFRRLLALHVGRLSPIRLAADGLTLGWGLLTA